MSLHSYFCVSFTFIFKGIEMVLKISLCSTECKKKKANNKQPNKQKLQHRFTFLSCLFLSQKPLKIYFLNYFFFYVQNKTLMEIEAFLNYNLLTAIEISSLSKVRCFLNYYYIELFFQDNIFKASKRVQCWNHICILKHLPKFLKTGHETLV